MTATLRLLLKPALLVAAVCANVALMTNTAHATVDEARSCHLEWGTSLCYCAKGAEDQCDAHNADPCYDMYQQYCYDQPE